MSILFDQVIDRRSFGDLKYQRGLLCAMTGVELPEEVYPMWIADSDFPAPPCVQLALRARLEHGIFGYPAMPSGLSKAVAWWQKARFDWNVDPDWVVLTPGVLAGLQLAVRALTQPDDGVIVQPPVYDHFLGFAEKSGRRTVYNPLLLRQGRYEMDFAGLELLLADPKNRLLVLCSPHNPVGRVWSQAELRRLGELCLAHGVTIVSDEIHADLVYRPNRQRPLLGLSPAFEQAFVALSSPSKTFNLAGLKTAYAIIPNAALRGKFQSVQAACSLEGKNTFGLTALQAAYTPDGAAWADALTAYLSENAALTTQLLSSDAAGLRMQMPEGTYLAWLDCSQTGCGTRELFRKFAARGVILSSGAAYGPGGEGHLRLNFACPRTRLQQALQLLHK